MDHLVESDQQEMEAAATTAETESQADYEAM